MERVKEAVRGGEPARPAQGAPGTSPLKVFVVLVGVLAVSLGALWLATRKEAVAPSGRVSSSVGGIALSDAEALNRFRELDKLRLRAYRERDLSLISLYLTSDSPLTRVNYKEIRQLIRYRVMFVGRIKTKRLAIRENNDEQIVIRQTMVERPRFVSEAGKNVGLFKGAILTVTDVTLRPDLNSEWKIGDEDVLRSRRVRQNR